MVQYPLHLFPIGHVVRQNAFKSSIVRRLDEMCKLMQNDVFNGNFRIFYELKVEYNIA
tara:strand:+ start:722 stop:895 length:174 start_codon:yes stop_codon:yes gene_type:complete